MSPSKIFGWRQPHLNENLIHGFRMTSQDRWLRCQSGHSGKALCNPRAKPADLYAGLSVADLHRLSESMEKASMHPIKPRP